MSLRKIRAPSKDLAKLQSSIAIYLQKIYNPPYCVHGYVPGKSIVTNAKCHVKKRWILSVDIDNFFGSITRNRILGLFRSIFSENQLCVALTNICVVHNCLPTGSPASPVLSNMIMLKMDKKIMNLCKCNSVFYTRYSDDLAFSTNSVFFPQEIAINDKCNKSFELGKNIINVFRDNGFSINMKKTKFMRRSGRQVVTGIIVNKKTNISASYLSNIRAIQHSVEKMGIDYAQVLFDRNKEVRYKNRENFGSHITIKDMIRGKIEYIGMVRGKSDNLYIKNMEWFNLNFKLLGRPKECIYALEWEFEGLPDGESRIKDICGQGTCFFLCGVGMITADHVLPQIADIDLAKKFFKLSFRSPENPNVSISVEIKIRYHDIDIAILSPIDESEKYKCLNENIEFNHADLSTVTLYGYPDYAKGETIQVSSSIITGQNNNFGIKKIMLEKGIKGGMSGGPVTDQANRVVGVMHRGDTGQSGHTIKHSYIPLSELFNKLSKPMHSSGIDR